ncbi:MAG: NAD(P)H-dependent oxidoreductase, partial [Litorimonas sp.]
MRVLAFAASNSRRSINARLVRHAGEVLVSEVAPDATVRGLDLNDYEMPIYSIDRENEGGIPDPAHRFFEAIGAADALILSFAEHNGSYTVAYKNVYDWASRIDAKVFQGKPMLAMSASPGRRGGAGVLGTVVATVPRFGADLRDHFPVGP